jgi:hypothetical protein
MTNFRALFSKSAQAVAGAVRRIPAGLAPALAALTSVLTTAMPYENGRPIFICRGLRRSLDEIWERLKRFQ